jgi:hypothetical protein
MPGASHLLLAPMCVMLLSFSAYESSSLKCWAWKAVMSLPHGVTHSAPALGMQTAWGPCFPSRARALVASLTSTRLCPILWRSFIVSQKEEM